MFLELFRTGHYWNIMYMCTHITIEVLPLEVGSIWAVLLCWGHIMVWPQNSETVDATVRNVGHGQTVADTVILNIVLIWSQFVSHFLHQFVETICVPYVTLHTTDIKIQIENNNQYQQFPFKNCIICHSGANFRKNPNFSSKYASRITRVHVFDQCWLYKNWCNFVPSFLHRVNIGQTWEKIGR